MRMSVEMEKMVIDLQNQPGVEASAETVWVESLQNGRYRLRNLPALAYDLDLDDEVEAHKGDDGRLHFDRVVERSGNVAYRIMLLDGVDTSGDMIRERLSQVRLLSSAEEKYSDRYYVFNIEPSIDRSVLLNKLNEGEDVGLWAYEPTSDDPYQTEK